MANFKEKLIRFMSGRYGVDQLGFALVILYCALTLMQNLLHWPLFVILSLADSLWLCYRIFSRNIPARQRENMAFLKFWHPVRDWFKLSFNRIRECRTHVYRKCPHCKAVLRLPRRHGEHTVCCPRCRERFSMHVIFGGK